MRVLSANNRHLVGGTLQDLIERCRIDLIEEAGEGSRRPFESLFRDTVGNITGRVIPQRGFNEIHDRDACAGEAAGIARGYVVRPGRSNDSITIEGVAHERYQKRAPVGYGEDPRTFCVRWHENTHS